VLTTTAFQRFSRTHLRNVTAWPLYACIGGASVMCAVFTIRLYAKNPDYTWSKSRRKVAINDDQSGAEDYYKTWFRNTPYHTRMEPGYTFAVLRLMAGQGWVPPPEPVGIQRRRTALALTREHAFEMPAEVAEWFKTQSPAKKK